MSKIEKMKILPDGVPEYCLYEKVNEIIDHINGPDCTCAEAGSRTCTEHQSATPKDYHRVCTSCTINHVENCDTCFGFGFKDGRIISISEAQSWVGDYEACPECGGTPKGINPQRR